MPTLDFTVDSLAALDDLVTGSTGGIGEVAYGSYLGETIGRAYGGEWTDEDGWQVAVALADDRTAVAVFDAAAMSIEGDPIFSKVAARLEAEGAVPMPDVPRSPPDPEQGSTETGRDRGRADERQRFGSRPEARQTTDGTFTPGSATKRRTSTTARAIRTAIQRPTPWSSTIR